MANVDKRDVEGIKDARDKIRTYTRWARVLQEGIDHQDLDFVQLVVDSLERRVQLEERTVDFHLEMMES